MKRALALWLVALGIASVGGVVTYVRCPGCIPRDRVNDNCEWTENARFPLDLQNTAHQDHLVEDAQLAEELGIRYADAEHGRRFGVAHHGGLLDNGRVRRDCLSQVFQAIQDAHDVTSDQVALARGVRNPTFDLAVVVLFLPLYALGATLACRWLGRRFSSNERYAGLIATGLASIAAALIGLQAFRLWGALWEVVRVGNGHMTSIRMASSSGWVHQFAGADFVGGVLLFWLVAFITAWSFAGDDRSSTLPGSHGILLR